jgi:hypothetical protein
MDFIVLTQCGLVGGYKVLEEQGWSTVRMWFSYTFKLSFFAGVISKLHTKTLVMQAASQLVVNCKMASFACIFQGAEKKVGVC